MVTPALLVSTFGDLRSGGGLVLVEDGRPSQLDDLSAVGLHVQGDELFRLLRSSRGSDDPGELLVYDTLGVRSYHRLDTVTDPHDVVVHDGQVLVASTGTNAVVQVAPDGGQRVFWRGPAGGDSWHLNSLVSHGGLLVATAFGRFRRPREWAEPGVARGAGVVFELASGDDLVRGLTQPHDPRPWRDGWLVCDSGNHALVHSTGKELRALQLDGWTRGLAVTDSHLFVGLSRSRVPGGRDKAAVAVVDPDSFALVEIVELPHEEVFDVVVLPEGLRTGVSTGMRTNRLRTEEQDLHELFRSVGQRPGTLRPVSEPLEPGALHCDLLATTEVVPGSDAVHVTVEVTNTGNGYFLPVLPFPVQVAVRLHDPLSASPVGEAVRLPLPRALAPGQHVQVSGRVQLPPGPQPVELSITLVQENAAWFDEQDPSNRRTLLVERSASTATA